MTVAWHSIDEEKVLEKIGSSLKGLSHEEATRRLQEFGYNELKERERVTPWEIFINQFRDIFVIMLLVATAISFFIGETVDAITIAAIVVLNSTVGFVQEYRSEKAIEAMKRLTAPRARVLRNGKETIIPAKEVVPGDILLLDAGDRVAADARLIEVVELKTNEAVLTGESTPIEKSIGRLPGDTPVSDRRNMVFMGTHVIYGRGKAVVTATGMNTEFGKIAEMVQAVEEKETPLKKKLAEFAKKLGIIIIVISAVIFILELYEIFILGIGSGEAIKGIIDAFETSVALAVSAVPEGLPAVVTVSLALGARELAKRNAIIRKLSSAETLGATTIICSDKTGTLTKGEMTVRKIYVDGRIVEVTGAGYEPKGDFFYGGKKLNMEEEDDLRLLLGAATLCSNASYDGKTIIGDTTEGALIVAAVKAGLWKEELEKKYPRIHEVPFTSERKRMTTVHETNDGKAFAYMKGAPEVVLEYCTHIIKNGEIKKLTKKERQKILQINEGMAREALRILAVAFKEISPSKKKFETETLESNFVFIGLTGMIDPPREEVKDAVKKCEGAGIRSVMITGDHKLTAVAIAREIGILKDNEKEITLTGAELDKLSNEEFEKVVEKVKVYARVSPEHKLRIVKALKKKGHIVAMTGDGVNDAPALKQADIGVAMGISGTDVTREAADMVLADDNFATIVKAVEGGRAIYDNIRKFSFFLMRCNFDELAVIGIFALMGLKTPEGKAILPLTASMILWINLVTDGGPALALTMDPPDKDIMKRPPRDPNESVLHGRLASIIASFISQFLGTAGLFYIAYFIWGRPLGEAQAIAFVQATLRELVIVWNCRSERQNAFKVGFTSNKFLLLAVLISAIGTIIIPYIGLFGTKPLTLTDWAIVLPVSFSGFLLIPEIFYGRKIWKWQ
jgi:Ca2+-transporting ATPase